MKAAIPTAQPLKRGLALATATGLALSAACNPAQAWNDAGHMVVAAVAYSQLQAVPAVRAKVDGLLQLNPHYADWTTGVPAAQRGVTAFLMAARWADAIKGETGYVNDGGGSGDNPIEPVASQNIGYKDKNRHKYWHYKDLGFSIDGTPVEPPKVPNVATQIVRFRATLAHKPAARDLKSYDLAWLLHLVGDVHQPLHATSRFTAELPHGDIGGNSVAVSCAAAADVPEPAAAPASAPDATAACGSKLHSFWDGALGAAKDVASAQAVAATLPPAPADRAAITDVDVWMQESLALARSEVYRPPVGAAGPGPYVLDAAYRAHAATTAQQQAALAGARLARLLITALK